MGLPNFTKETKLSILNFAQKSSSYPRFEQMHVPLQECWIVRLNAYYLGCSYQICKTICFFLETDLQIDNQFALAGYLMRN